MIDRILKLMEKNHITATQLTGELGLSGSAISEWKKGKGKPSTDAVVKIAKYFNVSADYILGISNEQKEKPTPEDGDGPALDARLVERLIQLTPEEQEKVEAFVQGLIAGRIKNET